MVGQVVNLRRIGNPPVDACIRPSAGGLTNPPQDAILPHKSLLPNTPPIRLRSRGGITCAFRPNRLLTGRPLGRGRHARFDRAGPRGHPVRERSRSFETFDQPIPARLLSTLGWGMPRFLRAWEYTSLPERKRGSTILPR